MVVSISTSNQLFASISILNSFNISSGGEMEFLPFGASMVSAKLTFPLKEIITNNIYNIIMKCQITRVRHSLIFSIVMRLYFILMYFLQHLNGTFFRTIM